MLPLKPISLVSVAAGLTVMAFVGFAANRIPKAVVLAKDASFGLPSLQGQLKGINPRLMAQKQPKFALVIGNANYEEDRLANPVNDATDMAKVLEEIGFEVTLLKDQDLRSMENAIGVFSQQLRKGGVGVFYYAGHGVQVEGENYLIPLKAQLQNEKDARYEALALGKVLNAMETAQNQVNIVIIDACRNNPFYRRWRASGRGGNVRGLGAAFPPNGIIIAYATRAGDTAHDGKKGERNSPFTSALLENIKKPNIDVQLMFRRVSATVKQTTEATQQPWTEGNLEGDEFYLNPQSTAIAPQIPTPVATPSPQPSPEPTVAVVTPSKPAPSKLPQSVSVSPRPPTPKPTATPSLQPSPKSTDVVVTPPKSAPSNPSSQPRSTLISLTTGVDYTPLRELLQEKKWKEADRKTNELMLMAAKREKEGWIDINSAQKFSCEDLRIIDQEWLKASGDKFGLSVQLAIYKRTGNPIGNYNSEAWKRFGEAVGWRVSGVGWKNYSDLTWSTNAPLSAPNGHLPTTGATTGGEWGFSGFWIGAGSIGEDVRGGRGLLLLSLCDL